MFWFGWLLKGSMEVSFLDRLLFIAEIATLFGVFLTYIYIADWFAKRSRHGKK